MSIQTEDFLWMLKQASLPMVVGCVMAFSLSMWSSWSHASKLRMGLAYQAVIVLLGWEGISGHAWLHHIAVQLRGGVATAFGLGIAMAMWRLSANWMHKSAAGFFFLLNSLILFDGFQAQAIHFAERTFN